MSLFQVIFDYAAPVFLVTSPVTSYADQILSIHRTRSSAGFSLDIPLIMLVSSVLKVYYWFGEYYSYTLLTQAIVMIVVQSLLLKVALDNRPSSGGRHGIEHAPFSDAGSNAPTRPYEFWQWKNDKPYWMFLAYFVGVLGAIHLTPMGQIDYYISFLGYVGLAVEATLPIPQIIANHQSGSCKGFRVSVIAAWILGDTMKMSYFFNSSETIPWAFKLCGMFQCICDFYLGFQFYMFSRKASPTHSRHVSTHAPTHSRHTSQTAGSSEQNNRWGHEPKDIRMN
ncbi:unnamed protein product [Penicillium salamii]|nr:unnamed protein product [Penicillium salamii]